MKKFLTTFIAVILMAGSAYGFSGYTDSNSITASTGVTVTVTSPGVYAIGVQAGLTNGFVKAAVTNGLAGTNALNAYFPTNGGTVTRITVGGAQTNLGAVVINGVVTSTNLAATYLAISGTNGLAGTNYVLSFLSTNGGTVSRITVGGAQTNLGNVVINGVVTSTNLAATYLGITANAVSATTATVWTASGSYLTAVQTTNAIGSLALTNGTQGASLGFSSITVPTATATNNPVTLQQLANTASRNATMFLHGSVVSDIAGGYRMDDSVNGSNSVQRTVNSTTNNQYVFTFYSPLGGMGLTEMQKGTYTISAQVMASGSSATAKWEGYLVNAAGATIYEAPGAETLPVPTSQTKTLWNIVLTSNITCSVSNRWKITMKMVNAANRNISLWSEGVTPAILTGAASGGAETDPIFNAWLVSFPTLNGNFIGNGAGLTNLPSSGASTTPVAIGSIGGSNTLNFATGAYQSALVTNALTLLPPTNGTHGARLEVWLQASGAARTLDFGAAIVRPSDSAASFPKTMTSNLTYIVLLRNSSNIWWLTSLVGGY